MFVKRITDESLVIGAPAKINLFLEILGRRPDGYHTIHSLFQAVSLFDRMEFRRTLEPGVKLRLKGPSAIKLDANNTLAKAYEAVRGAFGIRGGLAVELEKNIPAGGGLGGGSADAAATIAACNALYDLHLDRNELARLGLQVGSDVPFFFSGGQALVTGRGEILTETDFPTEYWLVLVTPRLSISTAASYAGLNMALTDSRVPCTLQGSRTVEELINSLRLTGNDFEPGHTTSYPILGRIRDLLSANGAYLVRLSGSGSTMFGIFDMAPELDFEEEAEEESWQINVVRPVVLPRIEVNLNGGEPWKSQKFGSL